MNTYHKIQTLFKRDLKTNRIYEGGVMFIDFETNKGVLQFTAYNSHNGYYGNTAYIKSNQLTTEEVL